MEVKRVEPVQKKVVHEENDWGITLEESSTDITENISSIEGTRHEYTVEKSRVRV